MSDTEKDSAATTATSENPSEAPTAAELKEQAKEAALNNGTNGDDDEASRQEEDEEDLLGGEEDDEVEEGEAPAVNGNNGNSKNGSSAEGDMDEGEEPIDDDEMLEEDDDDEGEFDGPRQVEEVNLDDDDNSVEAISNGGGSDSNGAGSRRKAPLGSRDVHEIDDDDDEIEELKDDDSDIMEVDADEASSPSSAATLTNRAGLSLGEKPKSNVVTIDDPKMLQRLANSASKGNGEKTSASLMSNFNTNNLLAGKGSSSVTITPAKPKSTIPGGIASQLGSGVTISQTNRGGGASSLGSGLSISSSATITPKGGAAAKSSLGYDHASGQLNDPNLKDETVVVEMPSFITPYIFENPPKETFKEFKEDIKKQADELKAKKAEEDAKKKEEAAKAKEERKEARRKAREEDEDYDASKADSDDLDSDEEKSADSDKEESDSDSDDSDVIEIEKRPSASENYFESPLGKFIHDLGMNLVQEVVQQDLLKQQIRKSQKDKSAAVMHAIMSLRKNLASSKDKNSDFRFKDKKCRFCSFKTESETVMQQHLETPHMRMGSYRCNFCPYDTKMPQEVLSHMWTEHGIRGRLERAPAQHQCPQCPYEDNMKGKLTRHKNSCDKRFRPEKNQEAPLDWEPPAKIPKPKAMAQVPFGRRGNMPIMGPAGQFGQMHRQAGQFQNQKGLYPGMPQLQLGAKGRGRPVGAYKGDLGGFGGGNLSINRTNKPLPGLNHMNRGGSPGAQFMRNQAGGANRYQTNNILSNLGSNSSVTIQSVSQRAGHNRSSTAPSISITPLPGRQGAGAGAAAAAAAGFGNQNRRSGPSGMGGAAGMKPGAPATGAQGGKGSFVICEICDGYIRDLEQLRNHMLYIHKVKIHPKMIHNRPPLNCQKCQFRFFTDQGLERHLLGSHGLVTASMQDLANKGQDQGRCPVCGKVYQWKLLNHVAKDHQKVLKPAHLSYKCTVCTATFGQYKLFENHVYQAHSGAAKKGDKSKQAAGPSSSGMAKSSAGGSSSSANPLKGSSLKMPSDITIIPKPGGSAAAAAAKRPPMMKSRPSAAAGADPDVIELDDEEEEIDDVEDESAKARHGQKRAAMESAAGGPPEKQSRKEESDEEGIEEIEDEEPEED